MARKKSGSSKSPAPPPPTWDERVINSLMPWRIELAGIVLFTISFLIFLALLSLPNSACPGVWLCLVRTLFGWGAYPLLLSLSAAGLHLTLRQVEKPYNVRTSQVIGFELVLLTLLPLSYQLTGTLEPEVYTGKGGGLVGWALSVPLLDFFGPFLTNSLYLVLLAYGISLMVGFTWEDLLMSLNNFSLRLRQLSQELAPPESRSAAQPERAVQLPLPEPPPTPNPDELLIIDDTAVYTDPSSQQRSRNLPPLSLLEENNDVPLTPEEIDEKKKIIEETLAHFGLPATVTQIQRGPAITQFGVEPGYVERTGPDGEPRQQKIRINQIAALRKDLALALAATRLRIQAPVPGRGIVGVEVPNSETAVVNMRSIVESPEFTGHSSHLAVALGKDVSGAPVAIDLDKMPHLLIAGTTGSGKSVCINALVTCLVFNNTPDKLHLIMIDPKKVELIRFNGLPHLIGQVEVEADRAVGVLRWLTAEMDRRYEMFAQVNARNIGGYNRKVAGDKTRKKFPYIAVFIDELADLMHMYPGDVERTLCRLAQMARATGIHMVVATQRPSTDVITGLIKANFPARLSFAVASSIDSRVILDTVGADQLLGKGDMLFLSPEASAPQRVQGVFPTDREIERIVTFWHKNMPDDFEPMPAPWESLIAKYALLDETDSLLEAAIELAQKNDTISASFLQRKLRLGYPRAARLMEHLYEMGLVEDPKSGGKTRRTLVDEDDDPLDDILQS
ncbi:MAG: DNA translocase FtsK 4TM domain-containing protein [Ardenticatenaceae bacterium]|nr:DNA translocase FtsK 4TM domain-containing protein [Ardenticatenaceae bacterium]